MVLFGGPGGGWGAHTSLSLLYSRTQPIRHGPPVPHRESAKLQSPSSQTMSCLFFLCFFLNGLTPKKDLKKVNFIYFLKIYLFIYFCLCWVFVSVRGLSLVAASGGHSSSWCAGLSLSRPLLLRSTGSRRAGSVVVAHGPSCSAACGIFPDQGSNPCPLHWQADSQPLRHQGRTIFFFFGHAVRLVGS